MNDDNAQNSIMVVDDTPANLQVLSGMLRRCGYRVRPVPTGRLALMSARIEPPELVLLDVNMPDMNGYEVCEKMRGDEALRDIPIIFVSAMHETDNKLRAFEAGGVDYVTKPFNFEEVEARVRAHLEVKRKQVELARANERLCEMERAREALMHMIVHDMRTPLTGLSGFLEILDMMEHDTLSEQGLDMLALAKASAERLIDMVTSVLDVSKLESGSATLTLTCFEIRPRAEEVVAGYRPEQPCDIRVSMPDGVAATADRTLLTRALRALLANACQASEEGGAVGVGLGVADGYVELSVQDQGVPIPSEARDTIFDVLGPANGSKRRYASGMGLTLCRMVAEAHGGQTGVDCGEDRGRRFWMRLPHASPT